MGILYKLDFASGKSYIGITTLTLAGRISAHKCAARRGSKLMVHCAWRKHGAPVVSALAIAELQYLLDLECRAVRAFGTYGGGYNMTPGGEISPAQTPEARAKMSAYARNRGPASEQTRRRMSETRTGRKWTEAQRANTPPAFKGRTHTLETKAKLSAARTGTKTPLSVRKKIAAWGFNQVVSSETRAKLSANAKARHAAARARGEKCHGFKTKNAA